MSRLRRVREHEGLSRAELARLADVAERTLQRCESGQQVMGITKHKVLNALNRRDGLRDYTLADLFESDGEPNDQESS